MKRVLAVVFCLLLLFGLCSCSNSVDSDSFSLKVVIESEGIYQVFYSTYVGTERYGIGAMANYDGNELNADSDLSLSFSKSYFEGLEDVSSFAIDFSPYGENDSSEIGTTNRLEIPAEYGKSYTVVISGSVGSGFKAELK